VAFASFQFELDELVEGASVREHLLAVQRRTGVVPATLANAPPLPEGCETLWRDFIALRANAGSNGFGPARISFSEMDAYQRLGRFRLDAWEIDAIHRADSAFMAQHVKA
jgi:hypothetical protein